ncbi:MAG: ACT domain-containing protein [Candidatus Micrarchaeota archaeon]
MKEPAKSSEKISELVRLYIKRRPFLKELIREGIVNYSSLARKISIELGMNKKENQFDRGSVKTSQNEKSNLQFVNAIKMALVRLTQKNAEKEEDLEGKILNVLKRSSLTIRSKVAVVISTKEIEKLKYYSYAESKGTITYIIDEKEFEKIDRNSKRNIVTSEINLNLVSVHSPVELEETPGVIAHILQSLASEGINVVEFVSCYTDTNFVIKQADTKIAYEILNELMG